MVEGPIAPPSHSPGEHHGTVYGYVFGGPAAIDRVDFDSLTHLAWHHVDMTSTGNVYNESSWLTYGPDFVDAAHAVGVKVHWNLVPHPRPIRLRGTRWSPCSRMRPTVPVWSLR